MEGQGSPHVSPTTEKAPHSQRNNHTSPCRHTHTQRQRETSDSAERGDTLGIPHCGDGRETTTTGPGFPHSPAPYDADATHCTREAEPDTRSRCEIHHGPGSEYGHNNCHATPLRISMLGGPALVKSMSGIVTQTGEDEGSWSLCGFPTLCIYIYIYIHVSPPVPFVWTCLYPSLSHDPLCVFPGRDFSHRGSCHRECCAPLSLSLCCFLSVCE